MTRIFTEGFESGDLIMFVTNSTSISSATARSGTYSFLTNNVNSYAIRQLGSAFSEGYFRFGLYMNSLSGSCNMVRIRSGTTDMITAIMISPTRVISVGGVSGTISLPIATWFLLEIYYKVADSGGRIVTKIDGVTDIDFTGDTKPGTPTTFDNFILQVSATGFTMQVDDIAVNDTSGTVDNSWCGDGKIIALLPNGNGDLSQLTGSDGNSTDNYLLVDERPSNNDTDYVEGSNVDEKDLYNFGAVGLTNISINRIWAESRSKDTVANGGLIKMTIKTNSTEYDDAADKSLLTSYSQIKGDEYLKNPNTLANWSVSDLDAIQAGPKTRS